MNARVSALVLLLSAALLTGAAAAEQYPDPPPPGIRWGWVGHVQFDLNSARVEQRYHALLLRVARQMVEHPNLSLLLTGHTDNTGDPDYNKRLSQRRSRAVSDFISANGVAGYRIVERAVGELRPVATNACDRDRQRNRRVDLAFFPRHRPPPPAGGLVYAPSRPTADGDACAKRPTASRAARERNDRAATDPAGRGTGDPSGTNTGAAHDGAPDPTLGAPAQARSPGGTARPGRAAAWVNPDDPAATPQGPAAGDPATSGPADDGRPGTPPSGVF